MKKNLPGSYLTHKEGFRKTLLIMKLSVLFLFVFIYVAPANILAQSKVTIHREKATYAEIFDQIKRQTGLTVVYSNNELNKNQSVAAQFTDIDVESVLRTILTGTNLGYELQDEYIILKRETRQQLPANRNVPVTGRVVDEKGVPIIGATVLVKGTSNGMATDQNGNYRIVLNFSDGAILQFSFLGKETQEIAYGGNSVINVTLREATVKVDDVVITGYMTLDKENYVGAIEQKRADDIRIAGLTSIDQMLQGNFAGMSVLNTTGQVGGSPKIRIRGTSTILGNQEPVWVVDGIIQLDPLPIPEGSGSLASDLTELREIASNAISWLNPSDIETITVLKDASATAIYGSKAANGVIVISTKKSIPGQISVSYSGDFSIGQRPRYAHYDLMNSQQLMQYAQEMYEDRDQYTHLPLPVGYAGILRQLQNKEISHDEFTAAYRKMEQMNTDWFDILFRNTFNQNHNISIGGGSEKVINRTSVSMQNQRGEAKGNDMQTFSASSSTTLRLFNNRLTIGLLLNGSMRETEGFHNSVSPFEYAYNTARTIPAYNDDGTLYYHEKRGEISMAISNKSSYLYNILNELDNSSNSNSTKTMNSTVDIRFNITDKLQYQGVASYGFSSSEVKSYATEYSHYITQYRGYEYGSVLANSNEELASPLPYGGLVQFQNANMRNYTIRNSLVYNNTFNGKHHVTFNIGMEARSGKTKGNNFSRYGYLYYRGEGFATVPLTHTSATSTTTIRDNDFHEDMREGTGITNTENNYLSEYFTGVYNYNSRYIVNVNARLDASNRFGQDKNKRFQPTWSVGAKWRIANERFMQKPQWIEYIDLSFSYGYQGNAVESISPYLIATDGGHNSYVKQYVLNLKSLPYPELGWEKTRSWNASIDFGLLQGRINFTANLYHKYGDVVSSKDVPIETGMNTAIVLGSKMENKGYDLVLSVIPIRTNDFTWQFSVNAGKARNILKSENRFNSLDDYLSGTALVKGESYSTFYAYRFAGLDGTNGHPTFDLMDIDPTDDYLDFLVKAGKIEPDFSGGLNTVFRYRNFSLSAQFSMSFGSQKRLPTFYSSYGAPTPEQNAPKILMERWRKPGDEANTNIPSIPAGYTNFAGMSQTLPWREGGLSKSTYDMYNLSDIRVADADFIRCNAISVSYNFGEGLLKKLHAKRLSVALSMANPFLITFDKDWNGYDPETGGWPVRRMASLSVSLTF
ncbi:SusC/RagA family TonB-linked outer membrane protein [Alistipes sp. OttesenSCG-928-B03]|nr:SusC/RagA family TonB-linked outer membrane protein [Alistipes sp. OttesenSCG-928-B03]